MRIFNGREAWVTLTTTPESRWNVSKDLGVDGARTAIGRDREQTLLPLLNPKFRIDAGARFFCIGSCFARNIEEYLLLNGFPVDSLMINFPKSEWRARANGLLNKFTTMSMLNEVEWALTEKPTEVTA